jgi:hypothetical protein
MSAFKKLLYLNSQLTSTNENSLRSELTEKTQSERYWYIDPINGSDDKNVDGTQANPLKTIQQALDRIAPIIDHTQYIILSSTGIYDQFSIYGKKSTQAGSKCIYIMGSTNTSSSSEQLNYVINQTSNQFIVDSYYIYIMGVSFSGSNMWLRNSSRIIFYNCHFLDCIFRCNENSYSLFDAACGHMLFKSSNYGSNFGVIVEQKGSLYLTTWGAKYYFETATTASLAQWYAPIVVAGDSKLIFYGSNTQIKFDIPTNIRQSDFSTGSLVVMPSLQPTYIESGNKGIGRILSDGTTKIYNYDVALKSTVTANYTASTENLSEKYLNCVTTASTISIKLPSAPTLGRTYIISDISGSANTYNIGINGNGKTVDGSACASITSNYGFKKIIYNGTSWIND